MPYLVKNVIETASRLRVIKGILRNSFNVYLPGNRTMRVGIPKEIKTLEYRVGMVPAGLRELVHDVPGLKG